MEGSLRRPQVLDFLKPPVFNDDERTYQSLLMSALSWELIAIGVLCMVVAALVPLLTIRYVYDGAIVMALGVVSLILTQLGQGRLACWVNLCVSWVGLLVLCLVTGGVRSPAYASYLALVVVAGLLLGWRVGAVFTVLSILAGLIMAVAESRGVGYLGHSPHTPFTWWIAIGLTLLAVLLIQALAALTVARAQRSARYELAERLRAEETLRESERRFRELAELLPQGVYECDAAAQLTFANRLVPEILGYDKHELLGRSCLELIAGRDREAAEERVRDIMQGATTHGSEYELLRKDGSTLPVATYSSPIWREGKVVGFRGIVIDVSERRRAEEALRESEARFRTMVEMAPDAIFVTNQDGRLVEANEAACRSLGYTHDELLEKGVTDIVAEPYRERAARSARECRSQQEFFQSIHIAKDGGLVPVELNLRCITYGGRPATVAVVRDITERRRAEEEKWAFYRETILSVTDGKLEIADRERQASYLQSAELLVEVPGSSDVEPARHKLREYLATKGMAGDELDLFITAAGEAMTNAVRHAGGGRLLAGSSAREVWAAVSDAGPGIETLALPRVALLRGFSTGVSLGLGYTLMLDICDHILLSTGPDGTTVVLVRCLAERRDAPEAVAAA